MNETGKDDNSLWHEIFNVINKSIGSLKRPYIRLLFLFILGFLFIIYFKKDTDPTLSIVLFSVVIIFFGIFALLWEVMDYKIRYAERTEEALKKRLREVVMELLEDKDKSK